MSGIEYESFVRAELGAETVERFAGTLTDQGLDPDDYLLIPVHPWQWWNKLSVTFAAEVAQRRLVCLGEGDDEYLAQQSIRTFFNKSHPEKHYVKTALSVLNMGFMRGLSAAYMEATPAINDWLAQLVENDPVLKSTGLSVIRERAAVGYRHLEYEAATDRYSPYRKMLAALWRESPVPSLQEGERLATMASLAPCRPRGQRPSPGALIERSGLTPVEWLRRYLRAYFTPAAAQLLRLRPRVHAARRERHPRPRGRRRCSARSTRTSPRRSPSWTRTRSCRRRVERIRVEVPEDKKLLSIFTDVFDCFFRFLAANLATEGILDEDTFWRTVAESRPRLPGRRRPNSPTNSGSTTCSRRSSRCPASTVSSCATTSRWWTSRTRPAPSSWSAP